ncbi:copper resistance CopC/CopD family protein [Aureimonas fodinaquatilis]|uniref:copper resistance CopC/CopD family protein n=1 Tax=Aureimonas fodinaquatilis TaxID=2565783 RepID=UPI001FE2AAC7|nr:copper resistance CopC/CopD family protein [Aureimonas fodinaquatilis]
MPLLLKLNSGRWRIFALSTLLCLLAIWPALVGQASAHASLVSVDPADGAMVETAPPGFSLTFSEPTSPLVIKLLRPDGGSDVLSDITLQGSTLRIAAPDNLGNGTYVLNWRIVAQDGHPVGGSSIFSIGAPSTPPQIADEIDWPVRMAIWASKVALYIGLFFGIGGAFFVRWFGSGSPQLRPVLAGSILAGLAGAFLSVGLQGLDALGAPISSLGAGLFWQTGLGTSFGNTVLIAVPALLAGLCALSSGSLWNRFLAMAAMIGVGLALGSSGHASAASPQWLTAPAVFVHAVCIAFWAGALLPLRVAFASASPAAVSTLQRFSRIIPYALVPLLASGLFLAVIQLGRVDALWATAYGNVLLAKLALLGFLSGAAAYNRYRLTNKVTQGNLTATASLRKSLRCEIVLVVAILAVAAVWRFTPPPRALDEAAAMPAYAHVHSAEAMADITLTPGRAGPIDASIVIMTADFGPLDAKELQVRFMNEAAGIDAITRSAVKPGDGTWRVDDLTLPVGGHWSIRLDILVSDFELLKLDGAIDLRK